MVGGGSTVNLSLLLEKHNWFPGILAGPRAEGLSCYLSLLPAISLLAIPYTHQSDFHEAWMGSGSRYESDVVPAHKELTSRRCSPRHSTWIFYSFSLSLGKRCHQIHPGTQQILPWNHKGTWELSAEGPEW